MGKFQLCCSIYCVILILHSKHQQKNMSKPKFQEHVTRKKTCQFKEKCPVKKCERLDESKCRILNCNAYVAIAYQDAWYPGMDFEVKDKENFVVKFMTTTRKLGQYKWPLREDIQTVQKQFLISAGFVPDCLNFEWLWNVKEAPTKDNIYNIYKKYS